jgi:hypothetical protein
VKQHTGSTALGAAAITVASLFIAPLLCDEHMCTANRELNVGAGNSALQTISLAISSKQSRRTCLIAIIADQRDKWVLKFQELGLTITAVMHNCDTALGHLNPSKSSCQSRHHTALPSLVCPESMRPHERTQLLVLLRVTY